MSRDSKFPSAGDICNGRSLYMCNFVFSGVNPMYKSANIDYKKCFGACHNFLNGNKPARFICLSCYNRSNACSDCIDPNDSMAIQRQSIIIPSASVCYGSVTSAAALASLETTGNHLSEHESGEDDEYLPESGSLLEEEDVNSQEQEASQESQGSKADASMMDLSSEFSPAGRTNTGASCPESDRASSRTINSLSSVQIHGISSLSTSGSDSGNKKRKQGSKYGDGERFRAIDDSSGDENKRRMQCTHCNWSTVHKKGASTTNLKRHLNNCPGKVTNNQSILPTGPSNFLAPLVYSKEALRRAIAEWVVVDKLPFYKVERPGFLKVLATARPDYIPVGRRSVQRDIIHRLFPAYRQAVVDRLKYEMSHETAFHATTDLWTCGVQHMGYMAVTLHYIEFSTWTLVHFILTFEEMLPPHTGENIANALYKALKAFGVHNHLFSATLDNASANNLAMRILPTKYTEDSLLLPFDRQYLHGRCQCHILNLLNKVCLDRCHKSLKSLRAHVLYIRLPKQWNLFNVHVASDHKELLGRERPTKDVKTRWNATTKMIETSLPYKEIFQHFSGEEIPEMNVHEDDRIEQSDSEDEEEGGVEEDRDTGTVEDDVPVAHAAAAKKTTKGKVKKLKPISNGDWESLEQIMTFMKPFEEYTVVMSARNTLTISDVLPIQMQLLDKLRDVENRPEDYHTDVVRANKDMLLLYQKYCRDSSPAYKLGHVLDPRFKLRYLELQSSELAVSAKEILSREYQKRKDSIAGTRGRTDGLTVGSNSSSSSSSSSLKQVRFRAEVFAQLDAADGRSTDSSDDEIKRYLDEPRQPNDTDVLQWWKSNAGKYPILSKIARDVLSMPASSVASEAAFSTSGQVITDHRASLDAKTVSVLMELESWMNAHTKYGWKIPSWSTSNSETVAEEEDVGYESS